MNKKEILTNGLPFGNFVISPKLLLSERDGFWAVANLMQTEPGRSLMVVPEKKVQYLHELSSQERLEFAEYWVHVFNSVVGMGWGTMILNEGVEAGQNVPHVHGHIFHGDILTKIPFSFVTSDYKDKGYFLYSKAGSVANGEEVIIHKISPKVGYGYLYRYPMGDRVAFQAILNFWLNKLCQICLQGRQGNLLMIQDDKNTIQFYVIDRPNPLKENNPSRDKEKTYSILKDGEFISPEVERNVNDLKMLVEGAYM